MDVVHVNGAKAGPKKRTNEQLKVIPAVVTLMQTISRGYFPKLGPSSQPFLETGTGSKRITLRGSHHC